MNVCVYCGAFSGQRDHVVPRSARPVQNEIVDACHRCNLAASDWVFPSFEAKHAYILIWRFVSRNEARRFRETVGAVRGRLVDRYDNATVPDPPDRKTRDCARCGREFEPRNVRHVFCSRWCASKTSNERHYWSGRTLPLIR